MNDEATNGELDPVEAPEESEGFKKGQEARERLDAIFKNAKWLRQNTPNVHFVFVCAPTMGVYMMTRGGVDDMAQMGLLEVTKSQIAIPIVQKIEAQNSQANQSGLVASTGAPIPLSRSQG